MAGCNEIITTLWETKSEQSLPCLDRIGALQVQIDRPPIKSDTFSNRQKVNKSFWSNDREKIYGWMVANDQKSYAELYKGAVIILCEKTPGYVRFVSHAVRDLMNGMAAAKMDIKREQTQYSQLADALQELWTNHNLPKGTETFSPTESVIQEKKDVFVPNEIIIHIQFLLREHAEGRRRSEESPYLFFQEFLPNTTPREALPEAYPKMWKDLRTWFMKRTHESGKSPEQGVIDQIETQFEQLETILLSVADRYSNTILTIDEILDNANA